jgi:hypothetical protein
MTISSLRLFAGSVWLTVATTLFCALLPLGLPQTSSVGSAFNPSTNVVALRTAETSSRLVRADALRPRDDTAPPGTPVFLPMVAIAFSFVPVSVTAFYVVIGRFWSVFVPSGAAFPRGPPAPAPRAFVS